jgi:Ca2+-binding RTX toxin-like protein
MTRAVTRGFVAILATLASLALPGATAAAVGPPYEIDTTVAGTLTVRPVGGLSTLAVQVQASSAGIVFTPAASLAPGCATTPFSTTCGAATMNTELSLVGAQLDVSVQLSDKSTGTVRLTGGAGSDAMNVQGPGTGFAIGAVVVSPGAGNDDVRIGGNVNAITSAAPDPGDDRYVIDSVNGSIGGTLDLGDGNDVGISQAPGLTLDGGTGDDVLSGSSALAGGGGSDTLLPTALSTSLSGGPGDVDRLSYALISTPLTIARAGSTEVFVNADPVGKTGMDRIEGGAGNDTLIGTGGQDFLAGGEGDDLVDGRGGGDVLDGGPGNNTVSYENGPSPVTVDLGAGTGGAIPLDSLTHFRGVVTGPGNDTAIGSSADEQFVLGGGDDILNAGAGNDTAYGGAGNDLLRGGLGADVLDGGDGVDTSTYDERSAAEPVNVTLATLGGDGAAGENDSLVSIENLIGGASNDTLIGDAGPNSINGGSGVNTLEGGAGDDQVVGGPDRDVITGGPGNDGLYGNGDDDSINAFDTNKPDADVVSCGESLDDDAQVDETDTVSGCEFSRRADVPVPVDEDQDGFVGGFDCDDHDPTRNQGATDVPGDGIDQDCDGFDQPVPFVDYGLTAGVDNPSGRQRGVRFKSFVVKRLGPDRRVDITCKSGRGKVGRCPFKKATARPKAGKTQVSFTSLFRKRRLAPGTVVEFRVTAPGFNGRFRRFTIRATSVRSLEQCIISPRTKPTPCPAGDEL